jgi:hypothetical protein
VVSIAEATRLGQVAEARKVLNREILEQRDWEEAEERAVRVHLENQKRLDQELMEFKERNEAEEEEKAKAGNGMKLATPSDILALESSADQR